MISEEHNVVFVHIPKCASSSVRGALGKCGFRTFRSLLPERGEPWKDRMPGQATRMRRHLDPALWERSFKFAVCRNPYDRLVSGWRYGHEQGRVRVPFDYFVRHLETFTEGWVRWHCGIPQLQHIRVDGAIVADHVCRFEQLDHDLDVVRECIGRPDLRLPHLNRSARKPTAAYYTPELQDLVFERFRGDFEYFRYDYAI